MLNILVAPLVLNRGNLWNVRRNIENITKSDSNFAPNFVDHHSLPDINFNGHCFIKSKSIYFLHTRSSIKNSRLEFLFTGGSYGKNVIIFGANMNSSVHVDKMGKDILILGEGPTHGLDDTALTAEAKYPINFTLSGKRFVLSLHYNGSNSFLFVNATKVYQFKAKNSEIKD